MTPESRAELIARTIHYMRLGLYDYAILEDADDSQNYVQMGIYGEERTNAVFEVTSRTYDGDTPLSDAQRDALVAMGLSRETNPNHMMELSNVDDAELLRLCERGFAILGTPSTFNLEVDTGYWHDNPIWDELEQNKARRANERRDPSHDPK